MFVLYFTRPVGGYNVCFVFYLICRLCDVNCNIFIKRLLVTGSGKRHVVYRGCVIYQNNPRLNKNKCNIIICSIRRPKTEQRLSKSKGLPKGQIFHSSQVCRKHSVTK